MGNLCGAPVDLESERSRVIDRRAAHVDVEIHQERDHKGRAISTIAPGGMPGPPRIHRDRTLDKSKNITVGVTQREIPLKDCSDELLLAEIEHRNIRLHERVTKDLVESRYKFGKPLGQGASAMVYQAMHKRSSLEVAI